MLATRHNEAHGYTPEQIWPDLIIMLDKLGQVVKSSPYDCYTRVNQTTTYPEYLTKSTAIAITEGIDYVGVDPYENSIQAIDGKLRQLRKIEGNYAHIAENGGEYANNDLLALKHSVWVVDMRYSKSSLPLTHSSQNGHCEGSTIPTLLLKHIHSK